MQPDATHHVLPGNLLGAPRAETDDAMLKDAFLQTADYAALTQTKDRHFIVGRRGTGKSALFTKTTEYYRAASRTLVLSDQPSEHEAIRFQELLKHGSASYSQMRATSRIAWTLHILLWATTQLLRHYKAKKSEHYPFLVKYSVQHPQLFERPSIERCADMVERALKTDVTPAQLPSVLARQHDLGKLEAAVAGTLTDINWVAVVLYDGLDEGWLPNRPAVALLDGLTSAVSDLAVRVSGVHGLLFIRDNMFRALAYLHPDFSQKIEGATQRLHWDRNSLFELVCARLRVRLGLDIENSERVWNRVVDNSLAGRSGFDKCLQHTLYRPRDVLVLINRANDVAARNGAPAIGDSELDGAATGISENRLQDLLKEYDRVLPGLESFVRAFDRRTAITTYDDVVRHLDRIIAGDAYSTLESSDFAVLGNGRRVVSALYGVGFLGFEDQLAEGQFTFCHDGARTDPDRCDGATAVAVHPCYWRALELEANMQNAEMLLRINDDYEVAKDDGTVSDLRVRQIGVVLQQLGGIPLGTDGASEFELWVRRAVRILFASKLKNAVLNPNPWNAPQRRDLVATNMAEAGFWKRVLDDYDSRQIVFEAKNYGALKADDYRQAAGYLTKEHGRFGVIVYRSEQEGMGTTERSWLQEIYHEHKRIVFTVPVGILKRGIGKMRNPERFDWIEKHLNKRLDTFQRNYLKIVRMPPKRRRR